MIPKTKADKGLRRTGIAAIGDVPWGTHFCQFYETQEDLIDTLVPYFREGLLANEFCMWICSLPLKKEQAEAALKAAVPGLHRFIKKGQIEILDYSEWYTKTGKFDEETVLDAWISKLDAARARGFDGLRLTGNTFWLEKRDWADFAKYEETINDVIGRYKMLAVCTYSLKKCGAVEIAEVIANHQFALLKRRGKWEIVESSRHKKTEQALRNSESKFRIVAENTRDFEFWIDPDGRYVYASPACERITGRNAADFLARPELREDIVHPDDRPLFEAHIREEQSRRKPGEVDFRIIRTDGSIVWIGHACQPVFGTRGEFLGTRGANRDITVRKLAEERLQEATEELAAANEELRVSAEELQRRQEELEAANEELHAQNDEIQAQNEEMKKAEERNLYLASFPELNTSPVFEFDYSGRIRYANPAAKALTDGMTPSAIVKTLTGMSEAGLKKLGEKSEPPAEREFTLGGTTYLEKFVIPPGGGVIRVYSIDITARKRAEEAVREGRADLAARTAEIQKLNESLERRIDERTAELRNAVEKLRQASVEIKAANAQLLDEIAERRRLVAAVEQAGEGIAIMDPAGTIRYINPAFGKACGWDRPATGKTYLQVLEEEAADDGQRAEIAQAFQTGGVWGGRMTRRREAGRPCELDVSITPVRDDSGGIANFLAIERDVTPEARLEQHLRQIQKVEALGTLAGGIAHDFNNILNPIFINTELALLDAGLDGKAKRSLETVLKAAERGRDLVKQIITFSRQKEQERRPIQAGPIVKETLKLLLSSLPTTIEIHEALGPESGFVVSDPSRIHQIVMNLCGNAAHAMRDKGGRLEVALADIEVDEEIARAHPDLKPGPYVRLTVGDTGHGMTREVLDRAFDPFFTTKKPGEGSGMGLAVTLAIVRNEGGAIVAYSEAGKGSTFNVFLPRIDSGGAIPEPRPSDIPTGTERILFVDDEPVQVESVRTMLERLGYDVVAKTNGLEALALFAADPGRFDLAVTDLTMPHISGAKLAEELIRIRRDLPVIICTGFSEKIDAEGALEIGAREFVMKPFSMRDMAEAIRRALKKSS